MALVRAAVSEGHIASIIKAIRSWKLGTMLAVRRKQNMLHSVLWLLVTANVVPSSLILVTLMMEVIL
jgi:hypothetical protein